MLFKSLKIEDTARIAESLAKVLEANTILALDGELGAGKTIFTKFIAKALGFDETKVNSPTFTIMQIYSQDAEDKLDICHFDVYRLNSAKDFIEEGFREYFDAGYLVIIEWANIIEAALPADRININISTESAKEIDLDAENIVLSADDRHRYIDIQALGSKSQAILEKFKDSKDFPKDLLVEE